jgi:MutT/NUDIX family protein
MTQTTNPNSPLKMYKFCPKCGGGFTHRDGNHLKCEACEYSYFVNQAPTAGLVIFDEAGRVMLAKRKFEPYQGTWQSVGGFVGLYESLEAAAIREAEEELGVTVRIENFLGSFPEVYEFGGVAVPFLAIYFVAKIVDGGPQPSDDVAEIGYFTREELTELDITYPDLRRLLMDYMR